MSYNHLTINERNCICYFYISGMKIRKIAELLQRSPSTISRELKRNLSDNIYNPANAQEKYYIRRQECHRKQINDDRIISYIKKKIDLHWSPEEIANRETNDIDYIPSTSTIYRMIHRGEIEKDTFEKLRRKGQYKRPAETRGKFNDGGRKIKKRPKSVYNRKELGHWEADTVESGRYDHNRKSKYCFVTLAERKSRYYIAVLVPDRKAEHVTQAIINALSKMPNDLVKTITFDRGKEFAGYERIENELKCATYFCDPYCAWQKGTNENTNGLLREFYPKGMDLSEVDEDELSVNLTLMNTRPRKCIQFKTPEEVLFG